MLTRFLKIFSVFFISSFVLRLIITINWFSDFSMREILISFTVGELFDIGTACYIAAFFGIFFILIPGRALKSTIGIYCLSFFYMLSIVLLLFGLVAEFFFWDEFSTRFNFIVIDYLIYTNELIGNSIESYPVYRVIAGIFIASMFIMFKKFKRGSVYGFIKESTGYIPVKVFERFKIIAPFLAIVSLDLMFMDSSKFTEYVMHNSYNRELSKNGTYEIFSAFWHNSIDYETSYISISNEEINKVGSKIFQDRRFNSENITYHVGKRDKSKPEHLKNVILVLSESMSADYLGYFDKEYENITKNIGNVIKESLFFDNLFATGTRTVRGIEATTLSIVPTPGQSIVRRKAIDNLFNIGTPFKERGYDMKFIYGGFGYFDNMNGFFSRNGFQTVDRLSIPKSDITFANTWGVCDEDLFNRVEKEADKSYKDNKKFFSYVLTTSNHRPFTYPDGKIDIPSKTGRTGALKYADYAFGEFIKSTKNKPWFKDTVIVYVADHCAGSAGHTNLPIKRYQIPMFFYSPGFITPKTVSKLSSQMDLAPTLFSILNFEYDSKFLGQDILSDNYQERAFIGTYKNLGYVKENKMCSLNIKKDEESFDFKRDGKLEIVQKNTEKCETEMRNEMIFYYQFASEIFKSGKMKNK